MSPEKIRLFLEERHQPQYRFAQAMRAFCHDGHTRFEEISSWPKHLRDDAAQNLEVMTVREKKFLASSSKKAFKALLELADGNVIETVLMSPKPGHWTVCISSQVGCAMACSFCATGKLGLARNLTACEITDQVLYWIQCMKSKNIPGDVGNIVYMGMGEPLANIENVEESLRILTDPAIFHFGDRHIAVSTSGLAPGIIRLAKKWPQIHLALSLHVANDAERSAMMPVNKRFPLAKLQEALKTYFTYSHRKVFLEYILLKGTNDSERHAQELIAFIHGIDKPQLLHVNLIVYNKTFSSYDETSREQTRAFAQFLRNADIHVTIRKNLGRDISGACGQLAGMRGPRLSF